MHIIYYPGSSLVKLPPVHEIPAFLVVEDVVLAFGVLFLRSDDVEHVGDEISDAFAHFCRIAHKLHGFVDGLGSQTTAARQDLVVLSVEVLVLLQCRVQTRLYHCPSRKYREK